MIDIAAGFFAAGLAIGCLTTAVALRSRRSRRDNAIDLPPFPNGYVVVRGDGHRIEREDLTAVHVLLHAQAHAWMGRAWSAVLAQVAADEAGMGIDAVEAAANERKAS